MSRYLSPKQIARAIQASESSVKRWCDKGDLEVHYTAGGHRKVALSSVVEFLRRTGQPLVHPELLGLPKLDGAETDSIQQAAELVYESLIAGKDLKARQIVLELYMKEYSLAVIFDKVITPAMVGIGNEWQCGHVDIYQERRGCEILLQLMHELRTLLPIPEEQAPVAIGGAISGDFYRLPTAMVEMILREAGWHAISLGDNLPMQTFEHAIEQYRPKIFWLSCSHLDNEQQFLRDYQQIQEDYGMATAFVVGGRALSDTLRAEMKYAVYCDSMQHLASFIQSMNNFKHN